MSSSRKRAESIKRFERRIERHATRKSWRDEYAIIGEDSWGNDYLGDEGGERSVRARRGGRADGNRGR